MGHDLFELPRYGLSFLSLAMSPVLVRREGGNPAGNDTRLDHAIGSVSVVIPGHSEGRALERCVRSLRAQSFQDFEIIVVSDGSRDDMVEVSQRLLHSGLIDGTLWTDLRCGKSAATNLGIRAAKGDIVVSVDCDCSFDRSAIERILAPLSDPRVGAVCGDILPRNADASLAAAFQAIEYLVTISLGKRAADMLGQVVCVSGAFGAFRREALDAIGGIDPGGGEDFDVTIRLRSSGWDIAFASDALCYTDVPDSTWALIRQRLRWERDCIRIRFRKHKRLMSPFSGRFSFSEVFHEYDFLVFHVLFSLAFPIYLILLAVNFGQDSVFILVGVQLVLLVLDLVIFILAVAVTGRWQYAQYALYVPGFGVYTSWLMKGVRIWAYLEEWVFDASRHDAYVPTRVRRARHW